MYGKECSISCGNCRDSEQCQHINGTCMNGCDTGYKGFKCIESRNNVSRIVIFNCIQIESA